MLTASRTVKRLRVSTNHPEYRYCVTPIGCSSQGSLYTIEVTSAIDYGITDPGIKIYAFSNPKAAQYFVKENIDSGFAWPEMKKRLEYAPDFVTDMPEAHIVCAGKAQFPSTWIYPAPLGINSDATGAEHGHAYVTETAVDSFTGPMAQGYLTIVVLFPTGSTLFSDETVSDVRVCSNCGTFGTNVTETSCPKCGTRYACSSCDYIGTSNICPKHNTVCNAITMNNSKSYSIAEPITITVQFMQE